MKGRSNALLIELIVVIFFFSISTVVSLQVFSAANSQSRLSNRKTTALIELESLAERISGAEDFTAFLEEWESARKVNEDGCAFAIHYEVEEQSAGTLIRFVLSAYDGNVEGAPEDGAEALVSLPIALYLPRSGVAT